VTRPQVVTLTALWFAGCGPSVTPPAELDRVCEQDSPVELLALDSGTRVRMGFPGYEQQSERLLLAATPGSLLDEQARADAVVWAVGPCGEDPVEVARGIDWIRRLDERPEFLLGCGAAGDVYALDATGAREPALLFEGVGCNPRWSAHGPVVNPTDVEIGPVVLHPFPADPWSGPTAPIVLLERARLEHEAAGFGAFFGGDPQLVDDELFAVTEDHALVRVNVETRAVVELATNVHTFDASANIVVWQARSDERDAYGAPIGMITALDRTTGVTTELTVGNLDAVFLATNFAHSGVVVLRDAAFEGSERMYVLPSAEPIVVPDELALRSKVDHRWLIQPLDPGPRWLWDPDTGQQTPFLDAPGILRPKSETVWFARLAVPNFPDPDNSNETDEAALLRLVVDREPVTLAPRAGRPWWVLEDDRVITKLGTAPDGRGTLVVVQPETFDERRIDDDVLDGTAYLDAWPFDVFYTKDDGDQVRLLRTRLPDTP